MLYSIVGYYPLSASLALFGNIVRDPMHGCAVGDLEMIRTVISFLGTYLSAATDGPQFKFDLHFKYVMRMFETILGLAEHMVRTANTQAASHVRLGTGDSLQRDSLADAARMDANQIAESSFPEKAGTVNNSTFVDSRQQPNANTAYSMSTTTPESLENIQETTPLGDNAYENYYLQDDSMLDSEILQPDDGSWFFPINDSLPGGSQPWYLPQP